MRNKFAVALTVSLFQAFLILNTWAQEGCLSCHGKKDLVIVNDDGVERSLFVDSTQLDNSVHSGFECIMCHEDAVEISHVKKLQPPACVTCHTDTAQEMGEIIHYLKKGASDTPMCWNCHGSHEIRAISDSISLVHPKNQPKTCGRCHSNPELVKKYHIPAKDPLAAYSRSIHGRLALTPGLYPDLEKKISKARPNQVATCSSCHTGHKIMPSSDPASTIHYKNIPQTCGKCHVAIEKEFSESVHAAAVKRGIRDAPVCTDCHGEHAIESTAIATSPVAPQNIAIETCGRCHASTLIVERYGLPSERLSTFQNSYHGLALRSGLLTVANCASCHGAHNILPSSDLRSMVHPINLPKTCGKCHGNVDERFARGPVHLTEEEREGRIVAIVRKLYIGLIVLVVGGMAAHNALDFYRKSKIALQRK